MVLASLTPQQDTILNHSPVEVEIPPEVPRRSTPYSKRLEELGLTTKAQRAEDDGHYFKWLKDAKDDKFRTPCSCSMLRTSTYYATEKAKDQYIKYQRFDELVSVLFSRVNIKIFPAKVEEMQKVVLQVRKALKCTIPGSIDKIGQLDGNYVVKAIYKSNIDGNLAALLKSKLPPGSALTFWHNYRKEEFKESLKEFVAPDLPVPDRARADMENFLGDLHQTGIHGVSKKDRQKFVYDSNYSYTNLSPEDDLKQMRVGEDGEPTVNGEGKIVPHWVPRNPRTGLPATHVYAYICNSTVRVIDLKDELWIPLSEQAQDFG